LTATAYENVRPAVCEARRNRSANPLPAAGDHRARADELGESRDLSVALSHARRLAAS
jgi:hypothetical protein